MTHPLARAWGWAAVRDRLLRVWREGMFAGRPELADRLAAAVDAWAVAPTGDVYARLHELMLRESAFSPTFHRDEDARVARRADQIAAAVAPPGRALIDVGCGDARVTAELARRWRLPPDRALAVDVFDRVADRSAITYTPLVNGRIACATGAADLALLLMVLHHEADPDRLLAEIRRAVVAGGRLFVRESDVDTPELKLFNAVMEDFYYQVFRKLPGVPNPAKHDALAHWLARIERAGFRVERVERPEQGNPFTPVHIHATAV